MFEKSYKSESSIKSYLVETSLFEFHKLLTTKYKIIETHFGHERSHKIK